MAEKRPEMGKWLLYRFFHKNPSIAPYLPETKKFTQSTARTMLQHYPVIYVKPVAGSRGMGIVKLWKGSANNVYVQKTIEKRRSFSNVADAVHHIDRLRGGKMYIVQRGIRLAQVNGHPFDIRVMVQRDKPGGKWLYSGMLAKIAGGNSVVTNTALSRGRVMDVEGALRASFGWNVEKTRKVVRKLQRLGLKWAKHFDDYQPYRELGFDVAIDKDGRIWLIEQNTAPSHALFARNKRNLAPYRRIQYRYGVFQRALRNGKRKRTTR